MFEAKNISVEIGAKKILRNVSLQLKVGETVALLGANGAGKSTLLKTLCGDIKPNVGEIYLENRGLSEWNHYELARKRAVLSQHSTLDFPFTVTEVALLGRNPHVRGRESERDLKIVGEALQMVEAGHLANQSFPTLSGGERQRVHLARILAQIWEQPKDDSARYLLLDEPTASLDLAHQHLTLQTARKFARENTAVVCVLHDLNLAAQYADRILVLRDGEIFAAGSPREVLTTDTIRAVFDVEAIVTEHPYLDAPLVVALGRNYNLENFMTHRKTKKNINGGSLKSKKEKK